MGSGFCQPSSFFYRRCLAAVSTSLLSVRGLSVGSASFNHVDHQRSDLYFRRQPARRDFRVAVSYVKYAFAIDLLLARGPVLCSRFRRMAGHCLLRRRVPASRPQLRGGPLASQVQSVSQFQFGSETHLCPILVL